MDYVPSNTFSFKKAMQWYSERGSSDISCNSNKLNSQLIILVKNKVPYILRKRKSGSTQGHGFSKE
jgi:hypothetical protein